MNVILHKAVSVLVFSAFILLMCAGLLVAARFGASVGYVGFAWLMPLAGVLWWNYEYELFGISPLNAPFLYTLLGASSVLCGVCFPLLVATGRGARRPRRWPCWHSLPRCTEYLSCSICD
jgi:hypothetical protein